MTRKTLTYLVPPVIAAVALLVWAEPAAAQHGGSRGGVGFRGGVLILRGYETHQSNPQDVRQNGVYRTRGDSRDLRPRHQFREVGPVGAAWYTAWSGSLKKSRSDLQSLHRPRLVGPWAISITQWWRQSS